MFPSKNILLKMKKTEKSKSKSKSKKEKKPQIEEEDSKEDLTSENNPQSPNLYSLLGVEKTATNAEIRKAYRRLVFVYHPDKNKTDPDAGAKFANITRAYKILSNPDSRKICERLYYCNRFRCRTTEHLEFFICPRGDS